MTPTRIVKRLAKRLLPTVAPVDGNASEHEAKPPASVQAIIDAVRPYTMTTDERIWALVDAVQYVQRSGLPGAFAECGVWRGGSVLTMIMALQACGCEDRDIYLYDTFEGMTAPTDHDVSDYHRPAMEEWEEAMGRGEKAYNVAFSEDVFNFERVRTAVLSTGYPESRLHFVRGPVEQTIPGVLPQQLALLRLDTDWYESTAHELQYMYPNLCRGGVLIVDDYGHWQGCRKAVDEYFAQAGVTPVLFQRVDYTACMAVKVG